MIVVIHSLVNCSKCDDGDNLVGLDKNSEKDDTKAEEYTFEEMATRPDEDLRPVLSKESPDEESCKTGSRLETKTR